MAEDKTFAFTKEYLLKLQHQAEVFQENGYPIIGIDPAELRALALFASGGKTAWIPVDIRWHDRATGELREISDGSQFIEVVTAAPGEILVLDGPSETHRLIPIDNLEGVRSA